MKYHYQEGISDSKKEGSKLKIAFFSFVGLFVVGYVGLLALTPVLSGWPLVPIDDTANALQSSDPGSNGNKLYIPRLNVASPAADLTIEGDPSQEENVTIQGKKFQLAATPQQTRQASPFYYLEKLQNGDEIFLDYNNTRYAYRVTTGDDASEEGMLTLRSSGGTTIKAQAVGTVARENGKLEVQDQAF